MMKILSYIYRSYDLN